MKKILLIILLFFIGNVVLCQEIINKEEGSFKVIKSKYEIKGDAVKLKDGRILLFDSSSGQNLIFDPKTDTIRKTTSSPFELQPDMAITLDDGKVLFIGPRMFITSTDFDNKVSEIEKEIKCEYKNSLEQLQCKIDYIKKYYPALYQQYIKEVRAYDDSMFAQLYDPVSEIFKKTDKLNIRRIANLSVKANNGKIYLFSGFDLDRGLPYIAENVEMYDPTLEKFSIVSTFTAPIVSTSKAFIIGNNKILILNRVNYLIFDTNKNSVVDSGKLNKLLDYIVDIFPDEKILYVAGNNYENKKHYVLDYDKKAKEKWKEICYEQGMYNYECCKIELHLYELKTGKDIYLGNIVRPSKQHYPKIIILSDGRILIIGCTDFKTKGSSLEDTPLKQWEIFDTNKAVTTFTPKLPVTFDVNLNAIKLEDNRILVWGNPSVQDGVKSKKYAIIYKPPKTKE